MSGTPFTADSTALLLLDHQVGTMGWVRTLPVEEVKRNTLVLAKVAKTLGIPVVLTSSMETQVQGPLLPELQPILPEAFERRIRRTGVINSLADPAFAKAVRDTGRRDLIIAGVTTDVCVISPAIQAQAEGYRVQVVVDASGSASQASEDLAKARMTRHGVELTSLTTLIAELGPDMASPQAKAIFEIVMTDLNVH